MILKMSAYIQLHIFKLLLIMKGNTQQQCLQYSRPPDKSAYCKTYVVGTQKNRLTETVLLTTQNMFKLIGKEINAILGAQSILIWTYDIGFQSSVRFRLDFYWVPGTQGINKS